MAAKTRIIMYLAISLDGFIARENDDVGFTYPRSFNNFKKMVASAGNCILGRRTFELGKSGGNFPLPNVLTVIVTSEPKEVENKWPNVVVTGGSPSGIIKMLKKRGFSTILLGGGATLVSKFMKAGLINEVYLDIMPIILKNGKKLFGEEDHFEAKLRLLDIKRFSQNEFRVHYKVLKINK